MKYIKFPPYPFSYPLSLHIISLSLVPANPQTGPVLPSCPLFLKKDSFVCLRCLYREFHYNIFMGYNMCILSQVGLSASFSFFLPYSPSYGDFNRFKKFFHRKYINLPLISFTLSFSLMTSS
jgi:hypothetical protein